MTSCFISELFSAQVVRKELVAREIQRVLVLFSSTTGGYCPLLLI